MKRFLSLLLILALLPMCLAVPALADETDSDGWWDILQYSTPNNIGSYLYGFSNGEIINFKMPVDEVTVFGLDMLVRTNSSSLSVTYVYYDREYPLTCVSVGEGLYRFYVTDLPGGALPELSLKISYSNGTYVQFYSLDALVLPVNSFPVNVIFSGYSGVDGEFISKQFTSSSGPISQKFELTSSQVLDGSYFQAYFHFNENWQRFDYIDLMLSYGLGEISSISAYMDGQTIPVEVSPFWKNTGSDSYVYFNVRLDLTGLDRSASGYPVLTIAGNGAEGMNTLTLVDALGYVVAPEPSLWTYWFSGLQDWLSSGFSSVTGAISSWGQSVLDAISSGVDRIVDAIAPDIDSSEFGDKLDDSLGQLGDAGAAMDSVSRPDIGQVDLDVSARVPVSGLNAMASIVNVVYENEVLGPVMWMYFTLALSAFVIFGRS